MSITIDHKKTTVIVPWFVSRQGGLPTEIVLHILSYLSPIELVVVSRLNKFCKKLFDDNLKLHINYFGKAFSLVKEHILHLFKEVNGSENFNQAPSEEQERFFNSVISSFILPLFKKQLNDSTAVEVLKILANTLSLPFTKLKNLYGSQGIENIIEHRIVRSFVNQYGPKTSHLKALPLLIQNKCINLLFKDVGKKEQVETLFGQVQQHIKEGLFSVTAILRVFEHSNKYGLQDSLIKNFKDSFSPDLYSREPWVHVVMARWAFDNEDNQSILGLVTPKLNVTNEETMQQIKECFLNLKKNAVFFKGALKEVDLIYVLLRLNPLNIDKIEKLILEKKGEKSDHYFNLAKAFLKLGNKPRALELLNKKPYKTTSVFYHDPEDMKRTTTLLAKINFEEAKRFIDSKNGRNDLLAVLASIYCKLEKKEAAANALDRIKKGIIAQDVAISCACIAEQLDLGSEEVYYFMQRINHPNYKIQAYLSLFDLAKTKEEKGKFLNKLYEAVWSHDRSSANFPLLFQFLRRTEQFVQDAFETKLA
jgi:hypothetical protein